MKTNLILTIAFLLLSSVAYAQIPTCANAIKAVPMGPFPCSVTVTWVDNSGNDPKVNDQETGILLERRLNGGAWVGMGGLLAPNTTSAIDATLQQSSTSANVYDYKVSATNSAGTAPGVTPVMASFTIPQALQPPKSPTGITVTFKGAVGTMACPTCSGPDKQVPFSNDNGSFVITSAAELVIDIQYP